MVTIEPWGVRECGPYVPIASCREENLWRETQHEVKKSKNPPKVEGTLRGEREASDQAPVDWEQWWGDPELDRAGRVCLSPVRLARAIAASCSAALGRQSSAGCLSLPVTSTSKTDTELQSSL